MSFRIAVVALGGVLLVACQPAQEQEQQQQQVPRDVTAEIAAVDAEFSAAVAAQDAHELTGLYTAGSALLPPNREIVRDRPAIQDFWQEMMDAGVAGAELTVEEAVGVDSLAIEVGRYVLSNADGDTIDEGKYMVWWKRTPDGWRLYRDIWNSSRPGM